MTRLPPLPAVFVAALLGASAAHAATGYKCTDAAGRVSFQDWPCPPTATENEFRYVPERASPAPAAPAADTTPAAPNAPPPPAPAVPPPTLYACTRYDGERYTSDTGRTTPYQVPVGMADILPSNVGDAFRDGRSQLSAPEFGRPPVAAPGGPNQIAAAYVWVQDRCTPLPPAQACEQLRRELDQTASKRRRAFKDERGALEARERELTERTAGC